MTLMETIYILNYKFDQIKIGFTIGIPLSEIAMNCAEMRVIVLEMCGISRNYITELQVRLSKFQLG